ncbi:MAG: ComEC/Rec2 family competence protein, partial [Patescibacteria group bacterium]
MGRSLSLLILGSLLILLAVRSYVYFSGNKLSDGSKIEFEGRVTSQIKTNSFSQSFSLNYKGKRIFLNLPLRPTVNYGDKLKTSGVIVLKKLDRGEIWVLEEPEIVFEKEKFSLLSPVYSFRSKVISVFKSYLPSDEASLLLGIVFGIKESFSEDFYEDLRTAGVLHVIAASGMNVSMLGALLAGFFGTFLTRQIAVLLTIFGIFVFTAIAGFEASIVRAAIMGTLAFSAQILGKQSWAFFGLLISGFLMLFVSPALLFDIGFQLSFSATLGLIYISPLIDKMFRFKKIPLVRFISEDANTTISAQIATLPIILSNFGNFSLFSVFANVLVLWTVPILMIIGG